MSSGPDTCDLILANLAQISSNSNKHMAFTWLFKSLPAMILTFDPKS